MCTKTLKSFLLFCGLSLPMLADAEQTTQQTDSLVTVGDLHFSVAMGIGEKTNPLVGGDDIPLYLVPSLRYYGQKFYFDNGDLGYTFFDTDRLAISALTRVNGENAHFSRWHPKNVFVLDSIGDNNVATTPEFNPDGGATDKDNEINIKDIKKRKWAVDAGIQLNWFATDNLSFTAQLMHDVNSVYQGFNGKLEAFYQPAVSFSENVNVQFTLGLDWSSAAMNEYYYGINHEDTPDKDLFYQPGMAINPYAKLFVSYKLNQHWKLFFSVNHKLLDKSVEQSPIVKDSAITTSFIGASYVF